MNWLNSKFAPWNWPVTPDKYPEAEQWKCGAINSFFQIGVVVVAGMVVVRTLMVLGWI